MDQITLFEWHVCTTQISEVTVRVLPSDCTCRFDVDVCEALQ